ncbi:hypothetical protein TWF481_008286 [Arthrobotrys musiformis]|uniref:Uncharacterized protein n=1 Tax=Arthrobotrys musiformis TaxID=47236 RepID=A0AAV9W8P5_9PEZI
MKFSAVLATFASVAAVLAQDYYQPPSNETAVSYTTTVVSSYVTYCPYATVITEGTQVYTVTEATTLTITNCPCTRTLTCSTTTSTSCPPTSTPVYVPPTTYAPVPEPTPTYVAPPVYNTTVPVPPVATGAASSMKMASGALVAVFGAAAMLL